MQIKANIKDELFEDFIKAAKTAVPVLRTIADVLESVSAESSDSKTEVPFEEPKAVKTEEYKPKEYSFTEVRAILTEKSRAGYTDKVKELVTKYGKGKLSDVKPECYGILIEEAEIFCRKPFTIKDIREELKKLSDDGFDSSIKGLLEHHYATSADDLNPEYYASFMRDSWRIRNAGN